MFEVHLKDILGLDYQNTLVSFGSRIVIETRVCVKRWFSGAVDFCKHYRIVQGELGDMYYRPVLAGDLGSFATQQMDPRKCWGPSQPQRVRVKDNGKVDSLNSLMRNSTIIVYFDDPVLPFFMKDLVRRPENKKILRMYERGIPSWAVFLPSYGLPYRPWMRTAMSFLVFTVSFATLFFGFYDLYKYIPMLRGVLHSTFGTLFEWFESAVVFRLSVLCGWVFATSANMRIMLVQMTYPLKLLWGLGEFALAPVRELIQASWRLVEVCRPVLKALCFIVRQFRELTIATLSLPYEIIYFCTVGLWGGTVEFCALVRNFTVAVRDTGRMIHVNREVVQHLSLWGRVSGFWQNIFRHIVKGTNSIYHFAVYSSTNLYKYRESTWIACEEYYRENEEKIVKKVYQMLGFVLLYAIAKYLYQLTVYLQAKN